MNPSLHAYDYALSTQPPSLAQELGVDPALGSQIMGTVEGFKEHLVATGWVLGTKNPSGRTLSGGLASIAFGEGQKARLRDQVALRLRQLVWVLKQEKREHRSLADQYWLHTLVKHLPPRYTLWGDILRQVNRVAPEARDRVPFRDVWEEGPGLFTIAGDSSQVMQALSYPLRDLFSLAYSSPRVFKDVHADGHTPLLWSWLTAPYVKEASGSNPEVWDWGMLLQLVPLEQSDWDQMMAHPLAANALLASGLWGHPSKDRQRNDKPMAAYIVASAKRAGIEVTEEHLLKGWSSPALHEFFALVSRTLALEMALPHPTPSRFKPRF